MISRRRLLLALAGCIVPDRTEARLALRRAAAGARDRLANRQDAILGLAGDGNGNVSVPGTGLIPFRTLTGGRVLLAHNPSGQVWAEDELVEAIPLDDRAPLGYRVSGRVCTPYTTSNHIARQWRTTPTTFLDVSAPPTTYYLTGLSPSVGVDRFSAMFDVAHAVIHEPTGDIYIAGGMNYRTAEGTILRIDGASGEVFIHAGKLIESNASAVTASSLATRNANGFVGTTNWFGRFSTGVAVANDGTVYFTQGDFSTWRMSKIVDNVVTRIAGQTYNSPGSGHPGSMTQGASWGGATYSIDFQQPPIYDNLTGKIYVCDRGNHRIHSFSPPHDGLTAVSTLVSPRATVGWTGTFQMYALACSPNGLHKVFYDALGGIYRVDVEGVLNADDSVGSWTLIGGIDVHGLSDLGASQPSLSGQADLRQAIPFCLDAFRYKIEFGVGVNGKLAVGDDGAVYFPQADNTLWRLKGGRLTLIAKRKLGGINTDLDVTPRVALEGHVDTPENGAISVDSLGRVLMPQHQLNFLTNYTYRHLIRFDP